MASTCLHNVEQTEVVKEVVLSELPNLNSLVMNKTHGDQTHFSPEKETTEKGKWATCYLHVRCLLSHPQTSTNNISRFAYNTTLQYLQDSDHNNDNIKYKSYLHRGPCTQFRKMTYNEKFDQSQNHFSEHSLSKW